MAGDDGFGADDFTGDDFGSALPGAAPGDPRADLEECKPPSLGRINGVGIGMYGRFSPADDGTYVKTQAFSVFWVPVFPIAQYLVTDADGGGWFFHGKVPMSDGARRWRMGFLAAAAMVALLVASLFWKGATTADVHVVNGLEVWLDVALGEERVEIAPGGIVDREVPAGPLHVSAMTKEGLVVHEADVEVPGLADVVIYNPLGAAPVFRHFVVYVNEATDEEADVPAVIAPRGTSWQVFEEAFFVFEDAPEQIDMSRTQRTVTRSRVALEVGGWETTVGWLIEDGRKTQAVSIAEAVAGVLPVEPTLVYRAAQYAHAAGDAEAALRIAARAAEALPGDVGVARILQEELSRSRPRGEVLARFRAEYDAAPGSSDAAYLLARLLPLDEARPLYEQAIAADPASPWPRRGLGMMAASTGEFAEAREHLAAIVDDPAHQDVLVELAGALAASDDVAGAQALLRKQIEGRASIAIDWRAGVLYERLRVRFPESGAPVIDELFVEDANLPPLPARQRALLAAQAGDAQTVNDLLPSIDTSAYDACDVALVAARDLDAAVEKASALADETLQLVPDEAQLQLACEFARRGKARLADVLWRGLSPTSQAVVPRETLDAVPDLPGSEAYLPPVLRAVLTRAAARRTDDEVEKQRLLDLARKLDPLHAILPARE